MNDISRILRDADPLRHEGHAGEIDRERLRRSVLDGAANAAPRASVWAGAPMTALVVVALIASVLIAIAARTGSGGGATLYAAVRFEVRLAEEQPADGLREARLPGSTRTIYLHEEAVITNADIESSALVAVPDSTPPRFNVGVRFTAAGAEKMRKATAGHIGKPMAVLIDGEVVMAPVVASPVSVSAVISGNYPRAQAERIVNGIGVR